MHKGHKGSWAKIKLWISKKYPLSDYHTLTGKLGDIIAYYWVFWRILTIVNNVTTRCISEVLLSNWWFCTGQWYLYGPISQISTCTSPISNNAPFCNRNVHICAHFCYKMVQCGTSHPNHASGINLWNPDTKTGRHDSMHIQPSVLYLYRFMPLSHHRASKAGWWLGWQHTSLIWDIRTGVISIKFS